MLYELVKKLINEHRLFASDMQNMESLVRSSEIDISRISCCPFFNLRSFCIYSELSDIGADFLRLLRVL